MPTTRIPNPRTKKWSISYLGEFFGDIINTFGLDLFSSQGKIKATKPFKVKYDGVNPPSSFVRARISDGTTRKDKVWAVCDGKKILRAPSDTLVFTEDESTGFFSNENTDEGSDILSITDDSGEPIKSTPVATPVGSDEAELTGAGWGTKIAQSFSSIEGNVSAITINVKKVGSPTDTLKISIQKDDSGKPDGTALKSVIVYPYEMSSTFSTIKKKIEGVDFDFEKKYWLVFERTGSSSTTDFYSVKCAIVKDNKDGEEVKDPYPNNEMILYNGSSWKPTEDVYKWITDTFTSSGNWTVPATVSEAIVECWGAGGGGSTNVGGGGGGAYSRKIVSNLVPDQVKAVVVGTSAANTNGGDSTFDGTVVVAKGGKSGANGGQGGQASEGTGDVKYSGGNGSQGTGDRGGGGGAGDSADGGSSSGETPGTGGENNGGIGGGIVSTTTSNTGRIIGGGGRSAADNQYAGARGEVRITYKVALPNDYAAVAGRAWGRDRTIVPPLGVQPGDLLLAVVSSYGTNTVSMAGWTKLKEASQTVTQSIFYRRATIGNIGVITGATGYLHWVVYRIVNAGTPQGTQTTQTTGAANPPSHDTKKTDKYLWIVAASWNVASDFSLTAPPTNYGSFIILPERLWHTGSQATGARTALAERYLEAQSEDPSAFGVDGYISCVVATLAIPFDNSGYWFDGTISVSIEIPAAEERLYLSTTKDIKFLDKENSKWRSLWQNLLRQKELKGDYPRVIIKWGKEDILFVANDNKISSISKPISGSEYGSSYIDYGRITFSPNYFIKWVVPTRNAIFIGLEDKKSPYLPSLVCYYEPLLENIKMIEIPEGTTVGFAENENCHIIDISGQMRRFTGLSFQAYDYLPTYFVKKKSVLPHRNGFINKDGNIMFLWEGKDEYAEGIWLYEKEMKRLYHHYSLGKKAGSWRALFNTGEKILAGASITDKSGIFSEGTDKENGWFISSKLTTMAIDENWQNLLVKYSPPTEIEGTDGIFVSSCFPTTGWQSPKTINSNKYSKKLSLGDKQAEWMQYKAEIKGGFELEEIQISHNVSSLTEEN